MPDNNIWQGIGGRNYVDQIPGNVGILPDGDGMGANQRYLRTADLPTADIYSLITRQLLSIKQELVWSNDLLYPP